MGIYNVTVGSLDAVSTINYFDSLINQGYKFDVYPHFKYWLLSERYRYFSDRNGVTHLLVSSLGVFKQSSSPYNVYPMVEGLNNIPVSVMIRLSAGPRGDSSFVDYDYIPVSLPSELDECNEIIGSYNITGQYFQEKSFINYSNNGITQMNTVSFTVGDTKRLFICRYITASGAYKMYYRVVVTAQDSTYNISSAEGVEGLPSGLGYLGGGGGGSASACGFDADTKQKIIDIYNEVVPVDFTPLVEAINDLKTSFDDVFDSSNISDVLKEAIDNLFNNFDFNSDKFKGLLGNRSLPEFLADLETLLSDIKTAISSAETKLETTFNSVEAGSLVNVMSSTNNENNRQLSLVVEALCKFLSKNNSVPGDLIFDGEYKNADNLMTKNITASVDFTALNNKLADLFSDTVEGGEVVKMVHLVEAVINVFKEYSEEVSIIGFLKKFFELKSNE